MNFIPDCCRFDMTPAKEALINCWNFEPFQVGIDVVTATALVGISASIIYRLGVGPITGAMKIMGFCQGSRIGVRLLALYPTTLMAAYGYYNIAKPFFDKTRGIQPEEAELKAPVERDLMEAICNLGEAAKRSFETWFVIESIVISLELIGYHYSTPFRSSYQYDLVHRIDVFLRELIYGKRIFSSAFLLGSLLSIPAIHYVAGPYFEKARAYSFPGANVSNHSNLENEDISNSQEGNL